MKFPDPLSSDFCHLWTVRNSLGTPSRDKGQDLDQAHSHHLRLPWWLKDKESVCQCGRPGVRFLGWEDNPRVGDGNPFQYSCLENPTTEEPRGLQSTGSERIRHD